MNEEEGMKRFGTVEETNKGDEWRSAMLTSRGEYSQSLLLSLSAVSVCVTVETVLNKIKQKMSCRLPTVDEGEEGGG